MRAWIKINLRLAVLIMVPVVTVLPVLAAAAGQLVAVSGMVVVILGNVLTAMVLAILIGVVVAIVVAACRSIWHLPRRR